jgi:hypothetical protein
MSLISSSSHGEYHNKQFSSLSNKKVTTLPKIEHPSKFVNEDDQNLLDIRGRSRDGRGNGQLIRSESSSPALTHSRRRSSSLKNYSKWDNYSEQLTQIPENVNTIYSQDRDKVRLPIFGKRFLLNF